ncbi:MAG: tetratricopeptide repeat protein [Desulfobacter sp.]|nr:MAG: tetratricopeptide repeat protein [Desulfobacter sp.]
MLCFIWVSMVSPPCFASGVDAANAAVKALKAGDRKKAEILFRSALRSNELSKENYIIVNNQLAELLRSQAKNGEAIDRYSESLYLIPDNPGARLGRGTLYHQMGKYQKAVQDLTRYTELMPKDPNGYIQRALAFRALNNFDRAISDMDHAVWLRPGNKTAHIRRGNTYFAAGNYNLALADFETAVNIDSKNPYAYQAMAWVYAACPNPDFRNGKKAVELAQKALKLENTTPADPLFPATLAAAYAESGMYRKAADAQKLAIARARGGQAGMAEHSRRLNLYEQGRPYRPE